jgi:cytochrome d ubiquinol oxidase subunit II
MTLAYAVLALLWLALIAYATLGGADFGGGVWDFLASGPQAERQRRLVGQAMGPVWEANHVWLIFLIVGLFTAFPIVFSILSIALYIPFLIALVGIVLRGAAFAFRAHAAHAVAISKVWGRVFSTASVVTPFMLGTAAAAVASGQIRVQGGQVKTDLLTGWTTPFALTIGAMALSLCATLAAVYLTVEAEALKDTELVEAFRLRAIIAGAVTAVLGALGLILSPSEAPLLWQGMLNHAIPMVLATMLVGLCTAASLFLRRYRLARILIVIDTGFLLGAWGLSQLPYLVPPDITVYNAASPPITLLAFLISTAIGMLVLLPSLWLLFHVFKGRNPVPRVQGQNNAVNSQNAAAPRR